MIKKPKYTAEFTSIARCATSQEKDKFLAIASLEPIKPLLPQGIDFSHNYDVLPFAANGAVINRANGNGHLMDTKTALACYKDFIYKPMDLEHNRSQIVGVILTAGFTKYGSNELLSESDVKDMVDPFNMSVGGLVYRINASQFADALEESANPESPFYETISLSWEIGYEEYNLVVGSPNLSDAEIITDGAKIKELSQYLRINGGKNKLPDGTPLYMQICGADVLGLAYGFTSRPAADVKGVIVAEQEKNENVENNTEIISHITTPNVKDNSMKKNVSNFQDLASITDENVAEYSFASISDVISKEISRISEEWKTKINDKETAASEAKASVAELSKTVASLQTQLDTIKAEQARVESEAAFNAHMSLLDSEYNLDDEDRKVITNQIKALDDASFEAWYASFARFAEAKKKAKKPTDAKPDENEMANKGKTSCASTEEEIQTRIDAAVTEALNKAKESGAPVVNNTTTTFANLKETYKNAFGKDGVILISK